jgi:fumarate hydratase class II
MLVTALTPKIGYAKSAEIAKHAHKNNLTLKQAALKLGYVSEVDFDQLVKPERMI